MLDIIINFLKSLFIKDKEEPTMEALHNISIPKDTKFRVVDDAGVDIETVSMLEIMEIQIYSHILGLI